MRSGIPKNTPLEFGERKAIQNLINNDQLRLSGESVVKYMLQNMKKRLQEDCEDCGDCENATLKVESDLRMETMQQAYRVSVKCEKGVQGCPYKRVATLQDDSLFYNPTIGYSPWDGEDLPGKKVKIKEPEPEKPKRPDSFGSW